MSQPARSVAAAPPFAAAGARPDTAGVRITRHGGLGVVTLDRPAKLNAIDDAMRGAISPALATFADDPMTYGIAIKASPARAFCAGGDILELYTQMQEAPETAFANIGREYALVWRMECFPKPTISFIDGPAIGSGVGLTLFGTHRVAGPGYRFQMPETAIGFFPDVGTAHRFARLPGEIGTFLGLTGRAIGRADALALGLVTHCIAPELFDDIEAALAEYEPVDPLLDERHRPPVETSGPPSLMPHAETIARCFAADCVSEIVSRLMAERRDAEWARAVAAELAQRAPLSLGVALRHIRLARHLDLRQTLIVDHRIACRMMAAPDFGAAVRALLIDRRGVPAWSPERLDDVSEAMVDRVLASRPGDELVLPTLSEH